MSLINYLSFEAIFKRHSRVSEFIGLISKFTAESLLWNCSALNLGLRVWDSAFEPIVDQDAAVEAYFETALAIEIKMRFWSRDPHVLFHRRQILLLQKLAIMHGKKDGIDVNLHPKSFGILLLMANDHLHNPSFVPRAKLESVEDYVYLMSELLPISESGDEDLSCSFIRTRKMLGELTVARKGQDIWFKPVCCLPIDTLEKKAGVIREHSFATVLKRWMQINPAMGTPLSQVQLGFRGSSPVPEMNLELHKYFNRSARGLFSKDWQEQS